MEKRVTARTKARARAASPISEAPRTDAPPGRAVLSATARPFTFLDGLEPGDGWSVGNRLPALPPGLSVGLMVEETPGGLTPGRSTPGRVPTGSGDVVVIGDEDGLGDVVGLGDEDVVGVTVPEIWTVEDADGSCVRSDALPITVNLTDFTDDAVAATFVSAWSCRCADCASIAPRSHDAVPSSLPHPKSNVGPALDGVACRRTVAAGKLPPVVQALTTH
jgi:hypothetical protein